MLQQRSWTGRREEAAVMQGAGDLVYLHVTPGSCGVSLRRHSSNRSHGVLWLSAWPFGGQVTSSIWVSCCVVGWLKEFLWAGNVRLKFRNMCVGKFLVNRTVAMVSAFITRNQSWPQDPGALQGPERLVIPFLTPGINHIGVRKKESCLLCTCCIACALLVAMQNSLCNTCDY